MLKILSIDWDWFFPNAVDFDWGHRESPFFYEAIWSMRCGNHNILTGADAIKNYVPTIPTDFWNKVLSKEATKLYVADSHLFLYILVQERLQQMVNITNLDAHHDCGYTDGQPKHVDCGNWAQVLLSQYVCDAYDLCYPVWRKDETEGNLNTKKMRVNSVVYGLPSASEYDIVFMCRSSSWTPPWYDSKFAKLVDSCLCSEKEDLQEKAGTKLRQPDSLKKARKIAKEYKAMLDSAMAKNKKSA